MKNKNDIYLNKFDSVKNKKPNTNNLSINYRKPSLDRKELNNIKKRNLYRQKFKNMINLYIKKNNLKNLLKISQLYFNFISFFKFSNFFKFYFLWKNKSNQKKLKFKKENVSKLSIWKIFIRKMKFNYNKNYFLKISDQIIFKNNWNLFNKIQKKNQILKFKKLNIYFRNWIKLKKLQKIIRIQLTKSFGNCFLELKSYFLSNNFTEFSNINYNLKIFQPNINLEKSFKNLNNLIKKKYYL